MQNDVMGMSEQFGSWLNPKFYGGSTVVLRWFYGGSTVVLRWFYGGSTVVLRWFYSGSTVVLS